MILICVIWSTIDTGKRDSGGFNMYVCICKGVTDKQIHNEIHQGVSTFDELQERLEVATCCGQCKECAMDILDSQLASSLAIAV